MSEIGTIGGIGGVGGASAIGAGAGRVLDFRRRPTPPRRRRPSVLASLLRPFATAFLVVAVPLAAGAWVLGSPRFALREVAVEGSDRIPAAWLQNAVAPLVGRNLVALPLDAVTDRLERHPWIASLAVEKELPDRLRIAVTERKPVALLAVGNIGGSGAIGGHGRRGPGATEALAYADRTGRRIAPVAPGDDTAGLLVVQISEKAPGAAAGATDPAVRKAGQKSAGGGVARALAVAGELGRANPTWAAGLTRVEVLSEEDFRLDTRALPFPLLVRRGQVVEKVRRLEALLPELGRRYARLDGVDLRFSRRIVVQPAAPSSGVEPPASSGPPGPAAEL
ncbi:MAG TPA: FtsQ-type POTRA domain-containing protein [Thermoanaerobaculia bacterium]|nr:FtsQ-type POTRA domain-containing protein [Thermoanaerobaculia bacterium]